VVGKKNGGDTRGECGTFIRQAWKKSKTVPPNNLFTSPKELRQIYINFLWATTTTRDHVYGGALFYSLYKLK
jgi:hypothetical protein